MINRIFACMIAVSCLCGSVPAATQVKCAIIADRDAARDLTALVSLLEVRLSQEERIRLVERSELDRVLQEQHWSAAGLAERESIIKAGQLLRAEAFVLITPESAPAATVATPRAGKEEGPMAQPPGDGIEPGDEPPRPAGSDDSPQVPAGQLIRIRVVETVHGLRLWEGYEQLAQSEAEAVSTRIAGTLIGVLRRVAAPPGEVVPIGIVDIHRVQLPEKYEPLARVLPGLLSARLGKEPRVIMLERESLGTLLREKQLTPGEESAFWTSAVLIDGYLQPGEKGAIEISLRLRKGSGQEWAAVQVTIDPNAAPVAVNRAATEIIKAVLRASSSTTWDSAEEAAEFHRQGQLLAAHQRRKAATAMFEAAHALSPEDVRYTGALFKNEWASRPRASQIEMSQAEGFSYSPGELAELASVLVRQIRDAYDDGRLPPRELREGYGWILGAWLSRDYFGSWAAVATEQVRLMNRVNRRIWIETFDKALTEEGRQKGDPNAYATTRGRLAWIWSDEPRERMAHLTKTINRMIMPPELGGEFRSNDQRLVLCDQVLFQPGSHVVSGRVTGPFPEDLGDRFPILWNDYLDELTKVNDPLVKLYALMTQAQAAGLSRDVAKTYDSSSKAVAALQEMLRSLDGAISDSAKKTTYSRMSKCLKWVGSEYPEGALSLYEKILMPLIEAGDAKGLALWFPYPSTSLMPPASEAASRHFKVLQEAADVLRSADDDPEVARAHVVLDRRLKELQPRVSPKVRDSEAMWAERIAGMYHQYDSMCFKVAEDLLVVAYIHDQSYLDAGCTIHVAAIHLNDFHLLSRRTVQLASSEKSVHTFIPDIAVTGNAAYVALRGRGIMRLPGITADGSERSQEHEVLTEDAGLPSPWITGLTQDGARLWVAYGGEARESGLASYEPATGQWKTAFCSTVRGDTPFSAGFPYAIRYPTTLGPDRLFFQVDHQIAREQIGQVQYLGGLWGMNTATGELTYFQLDAQSGIVPVGQKLLVSGRGYMAELDPVSKRADILLGSLEWASRPRMEKITAVEFRETPLVSLETLQGLDRGTPDRPFAPMQMMQTVVHDGALWTLLAEGRLIAIPRGAKEGQIMTLDDDLLGGRPALGLRSTPYGLIVFGEASVGLVDPGSRRVTRVVKTIEDPRPQRR